MPNTHLSPVPFPGFASPAFTQVPDELFDLLLPRLSDCELRVLLYIVRRTFGFKRDADAIALSQMVHGITTRDGRVLDSGTGLSKASVARGLAGLRRQGIIAAERRSSPERGNEPTVYRLRFRSDLPASPAPIPSLSQVRDTGDKSPLVSRANQALSRGRDRQQTGDQQTDFETSKGKKPSNRFASAEREPDPSANPSPSRGALEPVAVALRQRFPAPVATEDHLAVTAAVHAIAEEFGDRANRKSTVSRALNLFDGCPLGRDAFVDLLYLARGEVRDRRRHPGKAPLPRNQIAYFFAVVEDRLGLRPPDGGSPTSASTNAERADR